MVPTVRFSNPLIAFSSCSSSLAMTEVFPDLTYFHYIHYINISSLIDSVFMQEMNYDLKVARRRKAEVIRKISTHLGLWGNRRRLLPHASGYRLDTGRGRQVWCHSLPCRFRPSLHVGLTN